MFERLSPRERLLLFVAGLAVAGMGYLVLRHKPQRSQLVAMTRETQGVREELRNLATALESPEEPEQLERQLAEANEALREQRAAVDQLRRMFVPVDESEPMQELVVEISALAKAAHVTIKESAPYAPNAVWKPIAVSPGQSSKTTDKGNSSTGPFLDRELLAELCGQRMQQLTLETSFGGLQQFLSGLNHLKWQVTVVHFEVQAIRMPSQETQQPLTAKLVLAF